MDASIVIATRDRRDLLDRTLTSLEGLRTNARFEIIVADHGSTDGTSALVDRRGKLQLRRIDVPFRHESIADPKNEGAAAASGEILVFLDCGMICPPDFLTAHLSAHASAAGSIVAGPVVGWDSEDTSDPFWAALDGRELPAHIPDRLADPRLVRWAGSAETAWLMVWGANMSLSRRAFVDHGGFDRTLQGWGWDDLELAFRLAQAGVPPRFAPDAWAVHYPHPRAPMDQRLSAARSNWLRAYQRHRAPELETWEACDFWGHAQCQRQLREVANNLAGTLPASPRPRGQTGTRVLFGFARQDGGDPHDTFIVLPGHGSFEPRTVLSYGLRTWLPDGYAKLALASPALLAFDWSPAPTWPPMAHWILTELGRLSATVRIAHAGRLTSLEQARLYRLAADARLADFGLWEGDCDSN